MSNFVFKGYSSEEVIVDKNIHRFHQNCTNCEEFLESGTKAILTRDSKGKRSAIFCSELCARQKYLEILGRREVGRKPNTPH